MENRKGIIKLYQNYFEEYIGSSFYEYENNDDFVDGKICVAPACYEKEHRWYLTCERDDYNAYMESESKWKALLYPEDNTKPTPNRYMMKYFSLGQDENLVIIHGKERPVLLIKNYTDDFYNPSSEGYHKDAWICIPIFSYKKRHNQSYVYRDQELNNPTRFYMPIAFDQNPGMEVESVLRFGYTQMIEKKYIHEYKIYSKKDKMKKSIRLSKEAFSLMLYHFYINNNVKNLNWELLINKEKEEHNYIYFKDFVSEYIIEIRKKHNIK